jgi:hypothetical protein
LLMGTTIQCPFLTLALFPDNAQPLVQRI